VRAADKRTRTVANAAPDCLLYLPVNPLECKGNYSATSNNMKLVYWSAIFVVVDRM